MFETTVSNIVKNQLHVYLVDLVVAVNDVVLRDIDGFVDIAVFDDFHDYVGVEYGVEDHSVGGCCELDR